MERTIGREHRPALSREMMDRELIRIPREQRIQQVEQIIGTYMNDYGLRPRNQDLEFLAEVILYEELSDSDPHKVAHNDYPILSLTQLKRRMYGRGNAATTNMQGEARLEMEWSGVQSTRLSRHNELASDGHTYKPPIRRARSLYEHMLMDANTVSRNNERSEQYSKNSAPGQVHTYHVSKLFC
ncbi:MAG: hypothetical protein WDZ91_06005 [Paenibacillaceae bacterium]